MIYEGRFIKFRMASLRIIRICLLVFCVSLYIPVHCHGFVCLSEEPVSMFIFGDSVFDVGNNSYINTTTDFQANFWPYGETSFEYASGRPSDGRLIPDFITEYAKLPFIPPYLQPGFHRYTDGANFASAGGGALVETNQGFVIDLKSQLKYLNNVERLLKQNLGDSEATRFLSRAIFLFSIGSNDYFVQFNSNSTMLQMHPGQKYVDMVIGNLTSVIKEIYEKGGRKFGFLNLPPLGFLPVIKALIPPTKDGCVEEVTEVVERHNQALKEALHGLETQLKGFKYSYFDFYTSISERIKAPSKYGFKEGNIGCCGGGPYRGWQSCGGKRSVKEYRVCDDVRDYLIFDAAHPIEKAYHQMAELMWNDEDHKVAQPCNLRELYEL